MYIEKRIVSDDDRGQTCPSARQRVNVQKAALRA